MSSSTRRLAGIATALLQVVAAGCSLGPLEDALVRIEFNDSARFPVGLLQARGGPPGSVTVAGSAFTPVNGTLGSPAIRVPSATSWPLEIALVSPAGDTLASTVASLELKSAHLTTVWISVRASNARVFACAPVLARAPVRLEGAVQDTMYVSSWGPAAAGAQFPVC